MKRQYGLLFMLLTLAFMIMAGCKSQPGEVMPAVNPGSPAGQTTEAQEVAPAGPEGTSVAATVSFSLETGIVEGRMVFVGVGGEIDGVVNPDLVIQPGTTVHVTLINGDGILHDVSFPDFMAKSALVSSKGATAEVSFSAGEEQAGTYPYFCTQPGHRQAGQEGKLIVSGP